MRLILTIMAALLLGGIAYAQQWKSTVAGGAPTVTSLNSEGGRRVAFYPVTDASTTDSDVLSVGGCRVVTLEMFESGGAAEAYFMSSADGSKTYTRKLLSDVDGGGVDDVTQNGAAGRNAIYDTGPVEFVYMDMTVAPEADPNSPTQTVVWKVTCGE